METWYPKNDDFDWNYFVSSILHKISIHAFLKIWFQTHGNTEKGTAKKWPKVQEKCCKHFRRFEKMTGGRMQNHRLEQVGLWVNGLDNNKTKTIWNFMMGTFKDTYMHRVKSMIVCFIDCMSNCSIFRSNIISTSIQLKERVALLCRVSVSSQTLDARRCAVGQAPFPLLSFTA